MRKLGLLLVAVLLVSATRQRSVRLTAPAAPGVPTFNNEVVRIFQQNCQSCHRSGDIAPFPLESYSDAKRFAARIRHMTTTRQMPPWKPSPDCGSFEGEEDRVLTQQEIDTIAAWVDGGAPEGNPADLPPPRTFGSDWPLGEPDLVLRSPEPFKPASGDDVYRCFTIPASSATNRWVSAVDFKPDDRETVHHVIAFIDTTGASVQLDEAEPGPGYTCFGGPGFDLPGALGGWAPGARAVALPPEVALSLPANARVVLQVHYHPHHEPKPDQTSIGIYFADQKPQRQLRILPLVNTEFTIPAGDPNYRVEAVWPILTPVPMHVWLVAPHMHLLGKTMQVEARTPTGATQCLISVNDWDFRWQGLYKFKEPVPLPALSRVSLTATFDNSASNPRNPNYPPKAVSWGEATTDEMCIAFLGVTLDNEVIP
jgi:hypothetical protein